MTEENQDLLVTRFQNSTDAMYEQVTIIENRIIEYEKECAQSCRQDRSKFDKDKWMDLMIIYDMTLRSAKAFQKSGIEFLIAVDDLDAAEEEEMYGDSPVSDEELADLLNTIKKLYHKTYRRYFETFSLYQGFVRDYNLPRVECIEEVDRDYSKYPLPT